MKLLDLAAGAAGIPEVVRPIGLSRRLRCADYTDGHTQTPTNPTVTLTLNGCYRAIARSAIAL